MVIEQRGRVIVGVDGSLGSLRALRQAVIEARRRHAELAVVHVRAPVLPNAPATFSGLPDPLPWPDPDVARARDREAEALIATCIDEALGGPPEDITVRIVVAVGAPRSSLVQLVRCDADLLVVGTNRRRRRPLRRRPVGRYCVAHAHCPVLVVPPDDFARALQREEHRYLPLRRNDLWKRFDQPPVRAVPGPW
jgi:nucleotide-binding universal stress UspA family protein